MYGNFSIFKFRMLFNFIYIIYEIKSLRNFTLRTFLTTKISRSTVTHAQVLGLFYNGSILPGQADRQLQIITQLVGQFTINLAAFVQRGL